MKRSNRLILLIGIFLAVVAFVLILITLQGNGTTTDQTSTPTTAKIVVAATDIPLGSKITADMLTTKEVAIADKQPNGFGDPSAVIGQTARAGVTAGQAITTDVTNPNANGLTSLEVPAGKVGIPLQVDQVTGVGTLIKAGDYVDMVVGLTGTAFPVVTLNPTDQSVTVVSGVNSTSVKLLLQGAQVLGTLLPPPTTTTTDNTQPAASPGTTLNGQQEIVIVAVDAQQAEVIKYAQMEGNISLVLRSSDDFRDPVTGLPLDPKLVIPATTTGITLKSLVDNYGVLVPQLVEAILPTKP